MSNNESEGGFFENVLMVFGAWTGGALGFKYGEWLGMFTGAIILGGIGKGIGQIADGIVTFIFIVIVLLINSFTRRLIWEIVMAILQSE